MSLVLPFPFKSKVSSQQLPLSMQHCSSAGVALLPSAAPLQRAGTELS
jgi:hypothetical protein